jgi:hypothetical protein
VKGRPRALFTNERDSAESNGGSRWEDRLDKISGMIGWETFCLVPGVLPVAPFSAFGSLAYFDIEAEQPITLERRFPACLPKMVSSKASRVRILRAGSTKRPHKQGGENLDIASVMEELHTDSIDGGHEASYGLGHVPGRGVTPTL